MLIHRFVEHWAENTPEGVALIEDGRPVSYAELDRLSNRYAQLFVRAGVRRGDRALFALANSVDLVCGYLGAMKAGAIAVPLPGGARNDRLRHAIADCAPRVCIVDPGSARDILDDPGFAAVASAYVRGDVSALRSSRRLHQLHTELASCQEQNPNVRSIDLDLAAIIYTSGSTGEPRGVMLTHRNFVANAASIVEYLKLTSADRVMCVLPFHYVYGLSLLHTHLSVGGSVVIDNRFAFPNVVLEAMQREGVTGFAGVPSTFALLLHRSAIGSIEVPSLRYVTQAGGNMPAARIEEWLTRGPRVPFYVMYGATEAGARLTYLPPDRLQSKLGSIGQAIPNVEVNVVTEDGRIAGPGEIGELVARGSNIASGYWNNPDETRRAFTKQGYRTGDLGYADDDGFLYLIGRRHDMIKVGAHRVGAKEIEDVLHQHPAVDEAAVVGTPHEILGEVPVAFVALKDSTTDAARAILVFCAERLPAHKVPNRVSLVPALPKMTSGKVDRAELRAAAVLEAVQ